MSCDDKSKKPKPEFPPLLPAGLHPISEADLFTLTVANFKTSARRAPLWQSLMEFCEEIRDAGLIPCRLWINGSFLTHKTEPDDIDLIVEADLSIVDASMAAGYGMALDIINQVWHSEPRCLHTFLLTIFPVIHVQHRIYADARARWLRDWGHALLSRKPKGIALLEVGP